MKITKNELNECDDCGSKNLERVPQKGEVWCNDCGLVHNNQETDAKDNGALLFGEAAHYHAVRNDVDRNRNLGGTGPKMRYGSRGVNNPSKYYLLEKMDRSSVRNLTHSPSALSEISRNCMGDMPSTYWSSWSRCHASHSLLNRKQSERSRVSLWLSDSGCQSNPSVER